MSPADAPRHLERARRDLANARRQQPGLNADIAENRLWTTETMVSIYSGEYREALDRLDQIPQDLDRHHHHSQQDHTRRHVRAGLHLLVGEPGLTLERLEAFDDVAFVYESEGFRALAHLELGDLDTARDEIRLHASEAMTGRLSMQACDTVLLFAALADAEGDREMAADLIVEMGMGRSPITIKYGEALAKRLGIEDAYASRLLATGTTDYLGVDRAMAAVRKEAARRGWIDAES